MRKFFLVWFVALLALWDVCSFLPSGNFTLQPRPLLAQDVIVVKHRASVGITFDNKASAYCATSCSSNKVSTSFTATAGAHIIVEGYWCNNSACSSIVHTTDLTSMIDGSNTFVNKVNSQWATTNGIYMYEVSSATGGTHTITLTFNGSTYYAALLVSSWNGLLSGDAFDVYGTAFTTTANISCTTSIPSSGNLAASGELILGMYGGGSSITSTHGSGFAALNAPAAGYLDEWQVGGTLGSTASASFVNTSNACGCTVMGFKP
jgi:hypothetical protein